jgi:RNA polymerase sigma-70 factor, ECF subfamily
MATKESLEQLRPEEFEQEIIQHMDAMYAVALKLTKNAADARDLQQDALVRALRFHHKFQKGTYIKAWLMTILRNTFINDYRKKSRRPMLVEWTGFEPLPPRKGDQDMEYVPVNAKSNDVLEFLNDDVRGAVDSLPEGHRRTVIMADLQDMTYREIADELDCPLGTVMSRLHRGRRLLRDALPEDTRELAFG